MISQLQKFKNLSVHVPREGTQTLSTQNECSKKHIQDFKPPMMTDSCHCSLCTALTRHQARLNLFIFSSQVLLGCDLWSVGILQQNYTASHPRRPRLESSPPWKPRISHTLYFSCSPKVKQELKPIFINSNLEINNYWVKSLSSEKQHNTKRKSETQVKWNGLREKVSEMSCGWKGSRKAVKTENYYIASE
jgi:hypothetical protein